MLESDLIIENTSEQNSKRIVLDRPVKIGDKISYGHPEECLGNPLAMRLFEIPHISEIEFFESSITLTQDGEGNWDTILPLATNAIVELIPLHNPNLFALPTKRKEPLTENLKQINSILDRTIRPYLQMDGGDIELMSYEDNCLMVHYQGACSFCPGATTGTLKAIESVLKAEFNPDIRVLPV